MDWFLPYFLLLVHPMRFPLKSRFLFDPQPMTAVGVYHDDLHALLFSFIHCSCKENSGWDVTCLSVVCAAIRAFVCIAY